MTDLLQAVRPIEPPPPVVFVVKVYIHAAGFIQHGPEFDELVYALELAQRHCDEGKRVVVIEERGVVWSNIK